MMGQDEDDDEDYLQDKQNWNKWVDHSYKMRDALLMPSDRRVWVDDHDLEGVPNCNRCLETLQIGYWAAHMHALDRQVPLDDVLKDWFADPGQSIPRKPWGKQLCALGRRSHVYSFGHVRTLDAEDRSRAMGWPKGVDFSSVSEAEGWSLMGEGVHLACWASFLLPIVYHNQDPTVWTSSPSLSTTGLANSGASSSSSHAVGGNDSEARRVIKRRRI
jgi:hypothetical protein